MLLNKHPNHLHAPTALQFVKLASVAAVLATALVLSFATQVSAVAPDNATSQNQDPLVSYCTTLGLKPGAEEACQDQANITHARNVATYHCDKGDSDAQKVECVRLKAKSYLKDASKSSPKPTNSQLFVSALNTVLNHEHGSFNVPAPGFGSLPVEVSGDQSGLDPAADPSSKCDNDDCDFIKKFINPAINTLSACFGVIAVISIIIGGINYSTSEGDPQKTSRAKNRIFNTIIAVIAYMFLYAFIQFLVPGGVFEK
jgi:hypothetical protein